jgi:hypothetical protein
MSLPIKQASGEDFFLATVRIDTPEGLCWDDGFDLVGHWENVSRTIADYLDCDPQAQHSTVRIYQGEHARVLIKELRYQEQKRTQSNN